MQMGHLILTRKLERVLFKEKIISYQFFDLTVPTNHRVKKKKLKIKKPKNSPNISILLGF